MASKKTVKDVPSLHPKATKRKYLSQADVPNNSLSNALRVPQAIFENYGGDASTPLEVAAAIGMTPQSGTFRNLTGAAIAYGLTEGGASSKEISATELAERIFKPQTEGDDLAAKRSALLTPRVIREFLEKYDGSQLPIEMIARNVLEKMGVPVDKTADVHELILQESSELGLLREIKGKSFVQLKGVSTTASSKDETAEADSEFDDANSENDSEEVPVQLVPEDKPITPTNPERSANNRVFVTHGKNRALVPPIKKLLEFGQLEAVVSVEQQSVSKPVPDKVMDDMRSCSAAIIHVDDELRLMDSSVTEHIMLNPNVLIEIGAAMALYGRSFILLVKNGAKLPSNLQGLFEVRYSGETLDGDATIRLMEAINELKKLSD